MVAASLDVVLTLIKLTIGETQHVNRSSHNSKKVVNLPLSTLFFV